MADERIAMLHSLVAQNPADTFSRYALAMEYVKAGELDDAMGEFQTLLSHNPEYPAAYFHGGQTLEKLGRVKDAREFYEKGIQVTQRNGDLHTRAELEAARDMLPL